MINISKAQLFLQQVEGYESSSDDSDKPSGKKVAGLAVGTLAGGLLAHHLVTKRPINVKVQHSVSGIVDATKKAHADISDTVSQTTKDVGATINKGVNAAKKHVFGTKTYHDPSEATGGHGDSTPGSLEKLHQRVRLALKPKEDTRKYSDPTEATGGHGDSVGKTHIERLHDLVSGVKKHIKGIIPSPHSSHYGSEGYDI